MALTSDLETFQHLKMMNNFVVNFTEIPPVSKEISHQAKSALTDGRKTDRRPGNLMPAPPVVDSGCRKHTAGRLFCKTMLL